MIKRFSEWLYEITHSNEEYKPLDPVIMKAIAHDAFTRSHQEEIDAVNENIRRKQKFSNIANTSYLEGVEDTMVTLGLE